MPAELEHFSARERAAIDVEPARVAVALANGNARARADRSVFGKVDHAARDRRAGTGRNPLAGSQLPVSGDVQHAAIAVSFVARDDGGLELDVAVAGNVEFACAATVAERNPVRGADQAAARHGDDGVAAVRAEARLRVEARDACRLVVAREVAGAAADQNLSVFIDVHFAGVKLGQGVPDVARHVEAGNGGLELRIGEGAACLVRQGERHFGAFDAAADEPAAVLHRRLPRNRQLVSVEVHRSRDFNVAGECAPVAVRRERDVADGRAVGHAHPDRRADRGLDFKACAGDGNLAVDEILDGLAGCRVLPVRHVGGVAVARRARPDRRSGRHARARNENIAAEPDDEIAFLRDELRRIARERKRRARRGGGVDDGRTEYVADCDVLNRQIVSVQINRRAVELDQAERGPVGVRRQRHLVLVRPLREVLRVEGVQGAVHGDPHRRVGHDVTPVPSAAVAAVRVAGDDGEAVPAFGHFDRGIGFGIERTVVENEFAVDEEREVVVVPLPDRPGAGLVGGDVEPAVEAHLRPAQILVLPRGLVAAEVCYVASAHVGVVADIEVAPVGREAPASVHTIALVSIRNFAPHRRAVQRLAAGCPRKRRIV